MELCLDCLACCSGTLVALSMAHCVMALSRHIRSGALYGAPRHLPGAWFLSIWRILVLLCFAGWWRFVAHYVGTHTMADPGIHLKFFAPHNSAALGGFCPSGHKFWLHLVALCSGLACNTALLAPVRYLGS